MDIKFQIYNFFKVGFSTILKVSWGEYAKIQENTLNSDFLPLNLRKMKQKEWREIEMKTGKY